MSVNVELLEKASAKPVIWEVLLLELDAKFLPLNENDFQEFLFGKRIRVLNESDVKQPQQLGFSYFYVLVYYIVQHLNPKEYVFLNGVVSVQNLFSLKRAPLEMTLASLDVVLDWTDKQVN